MTLRLRRLAPLVLSALLLGAVLVAPAVAHADTLSWAHTFTGPTEIPNGESDPYPVASGFNAVSFSDATHGCAVGVRVDNAPSGPPRPLVAFTDNGGSSWSVASSIGTITSELTAVLAHSATDVWVAGKSGTLAHYDGSWTKRTVPGWPSTKAFQAIAFADDLNGWAVGDGLGIARTTDGGATWTLVTAPGSTTAALRGVCAVDGADAYAVGDGGLIKYISGGYAYARSSGTSSNLYGVTFADAAHGWAVGDNNTFVTTTNGGATWSAVPVAIPAGTQLTTLELRLRSVAFSGPYAGIAVGTYQSVWRTTDGGATWRFQRIDDGQTAGDTELRSVAYPGGSAGSPVSVSRGLNLQLSSNGFRAVAYRGEWARPDVTAPTTTSDAQAAYLGQAIIHLMATDEVGGSGVAHTYYRLDGGGQTQGTTVTVSAAGGHTLEFWSVDASGNIETPRGSVGFSITVPDTTPPTTVSNALAAYAGPATIQLTATDNVGGSGVAHTYYRLDGGPQTDGTTVSVSDAGAHGLEFWSEDVAGNPEAPHGFAAFTVTFPDITPPVTTSDAKAQYAATATISLAATDNAGGSGVAHTFYRFDGGTQSEGTTVIASGDGTHVLEFWSVDAAGNPETPHKTANFAIATPAPIDKTAPTTVSNAVASYVGPATISLTATDGPSGSGVAHTFYRLDSGAQTEGTTIQASVAGAHTLEFWSVDVALNAETHKTAHFTVTIPDTVAPVTDSDAQPTYLWTATISLSATDGPSGSGVAHTYWVLDGGQRTEGGTVTTTSAGPHELEFWSVDAAGNPETPHKTAAFIITVPPSSADTTAPVTAWPGYAAAFVTRANVALTASDGADGTGVAHTYYRLDGGVQTAGTALSVGTAGRHTLVFWSVDAAGNPEPPHTVTFAVLIATKVTITSNRTSVTHRHPVTFSGSISSTQPKNTHIYVYARRPGSSTWVKLSTRHTTSSHHWSYSYSPPTKGTWYFQARFSATSKYGASTSSSRKIAVK
jgi:photosystem II stability/assembly factor-like uncharacterized protein